MHDVLTHLTLTQTLALNSIFIFLTSRARKFTEGDAFIGYQEDTPAAVVFQATLQLERDVSSQCLAKTQPIRSNEDPQVWRKNVSTILLCIDITVLGNLGSCGCMLKWQNPLNSGEVWSGVIVKALASEVYNQSILKTPWYVGSYHFLMSSYGECQARGSNGRQIEVPWCT